MAGSFTDFLENKILRHIFGGVPYTPPSVFHAGYVIAPVNDTGVGSEPIGAGYERVPIENNTTRFPTTSTQLKTLMSDADFKKATANQGMVQAVCLWDAPVPGTGNMLVYAPLTTPISIQAGDILRIPSESLTIQLKPSGGWSNYLKNAVLNHVFGATVFPVIPMIYFAAHTGAPTDAAPGTEASGGGYGRVGVANNLNNFADSTDSAARNANRILFSEATDNWGTVAYIGAFDAATGGNYLASNQLQTPKSIGAEQILFVEQQQFVATVD